MFRRVVFGLLVLKVVLGSTMRPFFISLQFVRLHCFNNLIAHFWIIMLALHPHHAVSFTTLHFNQRSHLLLQQSILVLDLFHNADNFLSPLFKLALNLLGLFGNITLWISCYWAVFPRHSPKYAIQVDHEILDLAYLIYVFIPFLFGLL